MKDYMALLAGKLKSRVAVIFGDTPPEGVTELTKGCSVSSVSTSGVVSGKNQRGIAQGFVSSVSTKNLGGSKNSAKLTVVRAALKNRNTSPHELTKPTKPLRRLPWRPSPYWPACLAATRSEGIGAAQQLYMALALHYGHTPEETNAQLDALVSHIYRRRSEPLLRRQMADAYVAAHPYAWELKLNANDYYEVAEAA